MKNSVSTFDLEAAFKALDNINIPQANEGLRANRPALKELFNKKTGHEKLVEEYYNISDSNDLAEAQETRDAEIAKAKLARIEKIVDLDAESPDDLLASYVGKLIIQCPQCMTLFYKNAEDVEKSEEDSSVVNIGEACQHCGNESGYTLIGKVEDATADIEAEQESNEEPETEDNQTEEPAQENENTEAQEETLPETELEEIDLGTAETSEDEQDSAEESLENNQDNTPLLEQFDDLTDTEDEAILEEDVELEISDDDFLNLISSPEFTKPISHSEVKQFMKESKKKLN